MEPLAKPRRRNTLRLPNFDYSASRAYFVTICTQNRRCLFGDIVKTGPYGRPEMVLNDVGRMVAESWLWLGQRYDHVDLDAWVIMPNHLHGIIVLHNGRGGSRTAPTEKRKPLGRLIGAFKTVSTQRINEIRNTPGGKLWQRNYYEHIIRHDESLNRIRQYIMTNPGKWDQDRENPFGWRKRP